MHEVPSSVRVEVFVYIYHRLVQKIYFMQDKDPEFISYIVPRLHVVQLKPKEMLFKEFEQPEEMFFIFKGRIDFMALNQVVFKSFSQGSYFGEDDIIENRLRDYSARAGKEGAKLLVLNREHFLRLLDEFPKIADEFYDTARSKMKRTANDKKSAGSMKEYLGLLRKRSADRGAM